jgi:3-deoxy-D-manno-octulosonic-acid transferase
MRLGIKIASVRHKKARLLVQGQANTFQYLQEHLDGKSQYIWMHVSSLGEFEQGRPLIERIKAEHPEQRIVLTFFSPSGYEVRKNYDKVDAVCYLPFDTPGNARRFLDLVKPSMAIFVKYEFWGNFLSELKHREVPTYIISAIFRPGQSFFKPWGGMFRKMLGCFTHFYVQNEESRQLLEGIGMHNVTVAGDTRFDRVAHVCEQAKDFPVIEKMTKECPFTLVMGSSWPPDEDIVIPYFNAHPGMKLIIAPHEFDKERLNTLLGKVKRKAALYSETAPEQAEELDCLVIDCFGILSSVYRYGQMAYIGGGFGSGIHNVNEAAVYGIPVAFGPKYDKFLEAIELIAAGGGFSVNDAASFARVMDTMLTDEGELKRSSRIAHDYIQSHLGATNVIYDDLFGQKQDSGNA